MLNKASLSTFVNLPSCVDFHYVEERINKYVLCYQYE